MGHTKTASERYNDRVSKIMAECRRIERERLEQGLMPNPSLTDPETARKYGWEMEGREVKRRLIECGCCGQYHPDGPLLPNGSANYLNDCRNDANRFQSDEDFTARTGLPCVEVWLDEQQEA
jgi:hypothetical protein